MRERKYLKRLIVIILLGLLLPVVLLFLLFRGYAFDKMKAVNEGFYEKALETYTSLLDKKIWDLEMFAARISAESKGYDSMLLGGSGELEDAYQLYSAVNWLKSQYERNDVSEWGIYFYDIDKIITSQYSYSLDHFLYKYTGLTREDAGCSSFFMEENYSPLKILFDTTNTGENDNGRLFVGVCTRIGADNDRALVFCVISANEIRDSLAIVGGEGVTYYLLDGQKEVPLLVWGDKPKENMENILTLDPWKTVSGVNQKVLYHIESNYPGLSLMAYISGDSMQSSLIKWATGMRLLLVLTVAVLVVVCLAAIILSYKPMYELISEMDYSGGDEFDVIRNTLGNKDLVIGEQM